MALSSGPLRNWKADRAERKASRDPAKLRLAARLRTEPTLSIKAIARRVHLGTSKSAKIRLPEWMEESAASAPVPSLAKERP